MTFFPKCKKNMRALLILLAAVVVCGFLGGVRTGMADKARSSVPGEALVSRGRRLILSIPGGAFGPRGPIPASFAIQNDSSHDTQVAGECDLCVNHLIEVVDEHGDQPHPTELGLCRRMRFHPFQIRDWVPPPIRLEPGQRHQCGSSRSTQVDLSTLYYLKPGKYRAKVTHEDYSAGGHLRCSSDWVAFRIR